MRPNTPWCMEPSKAIHQAYLPVLISFYNVAASPPSPEDSDYNITDEELRATVKTLPNRRVPSLDGFSYLCYKTYIDTLAPYMISLYNSFLQGPPIPFGYASHLHYCNHKEGQRPFQLCTHSTAKHRPEDFHSPPRE